MQPVTSKPTLTRMRAATWARISRIYHWLQNGVTHWDACCRSGAHITDQREASVGALGGSVSTDGSSVLSPCAHLNVTEQMRDTRPSRSSMCGDGHVVEKRVLHVRAHMDLSGWCWARNVLSINDVLVGRSHVVVAIAVNSASMMSWSLPLVSTSCESVERSMPTVRVDGCRCMSGRARYGGLSFALDWKTRCWPMCFEVWCFLSWRVCWLVDPDHAILHAWERLRTRRRHVGAATCAKWTSSAVPLAITCVPNEYRSAQVLGIRPVCELSCL